MISYYCGPQTVGILRNYRRLMSNGLVLSGFPNLGRERLRQEPYLVLAPTTTISLNVPVELNFFYEPRTHLGSSGVGYGKEPRFAAPVMGYPTYGIWMTPYRLISITSPNELFMWKLMFLCDGEIQAAHSPKAVDTSTESNIPNCPSCWQAWLAALVQMSGYVMIFSILYSILSFVKVGSSKIQRRWLTTRISSPSLLTPYRSWSRSALNRFTSALETSENIELRLHTEDKRRIQVCPVHYDGGMGTTVRLYPSCCKFTLKIHLFVIGECPPGNIMVVIFPVINTAVATTKCRELVIPQMWLMRTSSYPFSVSVTARCVMRSLSLLRQEYIQRFSLLSTRSCVWLFCLLMTVPYGMGKLTDKRKTCNACCLKLGYFTTLRGALCSNFTLGMSSRSFVDKENLHAEHPTPLTDAAAQGRSQLILGDSELRSISDVSTPQSDHLPDEGVLPAAEPVPQNGGADSVQQSAGCNKQKVAMDALLLRGYYGREGSGSIPEKAISGSEEVVSRAVREVIGQPDEGAGSINEHECWMNVWITFMCNDRFCGTMVVSLVYILTIRSVGIGWQLHICTNGILALTDELYGTRCRGANELESSVMVEAITDNNTLSRVRGYVARSSEQLWRCEVSFGVTIALTTCVPYKTELWLCYGFCDLTMMVVLLVWEYFTWIICWGWIQERCLIGSSKPSCLARSHAYGTVDTGARVWLLGQGHGLRQLPRGVTRHPTKLDAAYTEKRQGYWLAWYYVVTCQWVHSSMSNLSDTYLLTEWLCQTCDSHLVEVSDEPTMGWGNITPVCAISMGVSNKLAIGAAACEGRSCHVFAVLAVCWHMSVNLSSLDLEDLELVIHYQGIEGRSICWCICDWMKSYLVIWSVVGDRVDGVGRSIPTTAKNAYQWCLCCRTFEGQMRNTTLYRTCVSIIMVRVTPCSSRWAWIHLAVMWYWLFKCNAVCTVWFTDQSINVGRRGIFNCGNAVDHNMSTQVVYNLSLRVVLISLVGMLAHSLVSTLSSESSAKGSRVRGELVSLNSYPGQLMKFGVGLRMKAVLKVCLHSSADIWRQHDSVAVTTAFALVVLSLVCGLMSCVMSWDLVECLALSSLTSYHTWDAAGSVAVLMVLSDATALSSTLSSLTWDASGSGVLVLLFLCNANVLSVKFSYYVSICWKSTHYAHEQADMRANHHTEDDERVGGWDLWCGIIQVSEAVLGGRDNRLTTELLSAWCPHVCTIRAWHGCGEDNVVREKVYPATGVVWHTLFWGPSCVCVTGSKRRVFACDNDVSRWRDGETDRNVIDVDRGQAWVLGVDVKVLKSWQHKENQLTAVKDVAAPAPPPEPPPTPK